jgi:glycosyltransferase involved in cell wall biosynthesis
MPVPLRLLHCISSLEMGGAERQLGLLAAAQAAAGHTVHVAFVRGGANLRVLEEAGVAMHHLAVRSNIDPALVSGLLRLLRGVRPDVVQTWLTQMDVAAGLAARFTGTPWILAERSSASAYAPGWKQRLRGALARRADAIVANSRGGEAYWRGVAPQAPRWVIGNAVPLERIRVAHPAEAPDRAVLFVGRLSAEKRVPALLRAFAVANGAVLGPLLLCGDGPERPALEQLAAGLGLGERARFLGFRPDVSELLHAAAVVVNPSAFEGCPNVVLDAMAAGRPLVVSDIPAHRELLDERAAWLVDPEDPAALSAALGEAVADPAEAARRSAEASRRVEAFGVARIVEQYDAVYRQVLAARGPQGRG